MSTKDAQLVRESAIELKRLYAVEDATKTSLEGLMIPIFAKRETLRSQILRDCGVAIGGVFPIVSNWLRVAADELDATTPFKDRDELEAVLVERGFEDAEEKSVYLEQKYDTFQDDFGNYILLNESDIIIQDSDGNVHYRNKITDTFPALLDAILEAK